MPLTSELRETIIAVILQALEASHPQAMTADMLMTPLRLSGVAPDVTKRDVNGLLYDLSVRTPDPWVAIEASKAAAEISRYRRTDAARVWLVQSGLVP
ncbi:MAG: hypothetical protein ACO1TE_29190 [Prosthecobacter sp.]